MRETISNYNDDRPLWTAPRLAKKLAIHHLTLLKKVANIRGKFEIPGGAFKVGNGWRWTDESVQAYFQQIAGAEPAPAIKTTIDTSAGRSQGRPRKAAA